MTIKNETKHTPGTGDKARRWLALLDLAADKLRRRFISDEAYLVDLATLWRGAREDGPLVEAYLMDLIRIRLRLCPVNYIAAITKAEGR